MYVAIAGHKARRVSECSASLSDTSQALILESGSRIDVFINSYTPTNERLSKTTADHPSVAMVGVRRRYYLLTEVIVATTIIFHFFSP